MMAGGHNQMPFLITGALYALTAFLFYAFLGRNSLLGWIEWIALSWVQLITQAITDQGKTGHADDYQCRGHKNQMGMAWEDAKSVLDHHPQLRGSRLHPQTDEAQSAYAEKKAPKP